MAAREIEIRLPVVVDGEAPGGLVGHVDVQLPSSQQRRGLGVLLTGLNGTHRRTADGRHVDTAAQAVRWFLEQIDRRIHGEEEGGEEDAGDR